jgi:hypothetical protein
MLCFNGRSFPELYRLGSDITERFIECSRILVVGAILILERR